MIDKMIGYGYKFAVVALFIGALVAVSSMGSTADAGAMPQNILVDASKGGGVWWFPQAPPFDPNEPHQGKALADHYRSLGHSVTELPRSSGIIITLEMLEAYDIVVRPTASWPPYTEAELDAYRTYVSSGGKLLLLSDLVHPGEEDTLALRFGIEFRGVSRGENVIDTFTPHPITDGVVSASYGVGSGIFAVPETAATLGFLSEETYIDLNDNGFQDPGEPSAAPVLGVMPYGDGTIVFLGDTNTLLSVPQPLVDNILDWLIDYNPPSETVISYRIQMRYSPPSAPGFFQARARIIDPYAPAPVPGALVSATLTLPDGTVSTQAVSDDRGWVYFIEPTTPGGSCTVTINEISAAGYVFEPAIGVTTKTIDCSAATGQPEWQ